MTWFLLFGTGMPQEKLFLLTERSLRPLFTKLITSFFLDRGAIKSGLAS